jgi:hypothetical protein
LEILPLCIKSSGSVSCPRDSISGTAPVNKDIINVAINNIFFIKSPYLKTGVKKIPAITVVSFLTPFFGGEGGI